MGSMKSRGNTCYEHTTAGCATDEKAAELRR